MLRFIGVALPLVLVALVACASEDPDVSRRGGPLPSGGSGGSGGSGAAAGDPDEGPIVPFCDALNVVRDKCQRCHGDPREHAAPVSFLVYDDFQAQYYTTDQLWWQVMIPAVTKGFMPYVALNDPPSNVMPPVEPLTDEQKATLLGWLHQGAKPEGGTDCP